MYITQGEGLYRSEASEDSDTFAAQKHGKKRRRSVWREVFCMLCLREPNMCQPGGGTSERRKGEGRGIEGNTNRERKKYTGWLCVKILTVQAKDG